MNMIYVRLDDLNMVLVLLDQRRSRAPGGFSTTPPATEQIAEY